RKRRRRRLPRRADESGNLVSLVIELGDWMGNLAIQFCSVSQFNYPITRLPNYQISVQQVALAELHERAEGLVPGGCDLAGGDSAFNLLTQRGRPGEAINGHLVVLVLVRRLFPFELIRCGRA